MAKNSVLIALSIVMIGVVTYLFLHHKPERKVGYVDIKLLYNGFEMKKQMEQKYLQAKQMRERVLDSAKFRLNSLLKKIDSEKEKNSKTIEEFEKMKEHFYEKKGLFEEENEKLSRQYDEQILVQLNQYVKDYGTTQHYDLLLGNDGNGALMYATEGLDRTKEVLEFINARYNGTK